MNHLIKFLTILSLDLINQKHIIIRDRKDAIEQAVNNLSNNETLLILGKGVENYQLIMGKKIYHNDIEIIKNLI